MFNDKILMDKQTMTDKEKEYIKRKKFKINDDKIFDSSRF